MAWQFPLSRSVATIAVDLTAADSVFVASGVVVASTGDHAIRGFGSNHQVVIAGTVTSGDLSAVDFGAASEHDNRVTVEARGEIRSFGGFAIELSGFHNQVTNAGLIYAKDWAIYLFLNNTANVTAIANTGTILADDTGILRGALSTEPITFTNAGTLSAPTAYSDFSAFSVSDLIINAGRIFGTIDLGRGNDSYSGTAGRLGGKLFGGNGFDVVIGGADHDWFEGGADGDALAGNAGNDRLFGDAGNDTLTGGLGNDILSGGLNSDTLFGGAGVDDLTGGANNDYFVFNTALNALTNRDAVRDFSHADDTFRLENAIFTKLGAGVHPLSAAFFRAGAAATDANDYIVYNRATGALSYDANGNAAGGAVAFAVLVNKPLLAANDFVVI